MQRKPFAKQRFNILKISKLVIIIIFILVLIYFASQYGVENIRTDIEELGIWAPIGIFGLRFTSVILPALPSTAYSILAGSLFGFKKGIFIICLSDICSCSISFFISRNYGKDIVRKFVGQRFIKRVENISQRHLENNFFLMTGFLMTGLFDFVSYAIGLTKTPWKKFAPALLISILISNPPIVALGAGLLVGGKKLLVIALISIFFLALVSGKIRKANQVI